MDMVDMLRIKIIAALVYENILEITYFGPNYPVPNPCKFLGCEHTEDNVGRPSQQSALKACRRGVWLSWWYSATDSAQLISFLS